jgi:CheY-like chemotaxis protein
VHLLVRSAIEICQREASAKLHVELKATRHLVRGDSTRLQQIFWNLISNAIKFTGRNGEITVRSSDAPDGCVRVEVIDTGEGIDPAVLPRLFTAFEQGDIRTVRKQAGLGLGLAISKRLVEAHNGKITAMSEGRGRGATFVVELPTVMQSLVTTTVAPYAPENQHGDGKSLHVLLVEDHEPTLVVMSKLLRSLGHRVSTATTAASARATAVQEQFDLIISDLGLPDGSGLDVMRSLRDRYAGRGIALTGYGMESDVAASKNAGFTEHLTKPVDLAILRAAITRVTDRKPARH